MGVAFDVVSSDAREVSIPGEPERTVTLNALAKCAAVAALPIADGRHVIAADTIVWLDGKIYGKPRDIEEAKRFLHELSGRTHRVYTGVAIDGEAASYISEVTFRSLTEEDIDNYLRLANTIDRAGAYDIDAHGDMVVAGWTGSYENIMGLPKESLHLHTLLHTCCGPCASACVPRLVEQGRNVTLFFSNSNIDTPEEFEKRRAAAEALAAADGVRLVCDAYDHADWLENVAKGYENEPERGKRCERCFRYNLARTAKFAAENSFDEFTTSLTVSPHKPSRVVFSSSDDPRFLKFDFKKRDGFKLSVQRSAQLSLYRQAYCGCEFSKQSNDTKPPCN